MITAVGTLALVATVLAVTIMVRRRESDTGGAVMICEPCQTAGHQEGDCEDSQRGAAVYRSCSCQHRTAVVDAGRSDVNGQQTKMGERG